MAPLFFCVSGEAPAQYLLKAFSPWRRIPVCSGRQLSSRQTTKPSRTSRAGLQFRLPASDDFRQSATANWQCILASACHVPRELVTFSPRHARVGTKFAFHNLFPANCQAHHDAA